MTEVRISSQSERPSAGIEDTPEASIGTGGRGHQRHRKVHSLIDKVYDRSNLTKAWKHVRENKGSAGIDGLTIAAFTEREDELLARLHEQLRDRTYRPQAVKRVAIPKAGGGTRNLGIPSVIDRVVQQALVQKMTSIFEPLFADCSFGYRPGRSPHMAMRKVWREINEGNLWILDADLRSYFDKIDQERLVDLIAKEISDGRVLRLIRSFLEAERSSRSATGSSSAWSVRPVPVRAACYARSLGCISQSKARLSLASRRRTWEFCFKTTLCCRGKPRARTSPLG